MIVALSHRLAREPGQFHLQIVGTGALFSDYRTLLEELSDVATYKGHCSALHSRDLDGFEAQVRLVAAAVTDPQRRPQIQALARSEAERRFGPATVCGELLQVFRTVACAEAERP